MYVGFSLSKIKLPESRSALRENKTEIYRVCHLLIITHLIRFHHMHVGRHTFMGRTAKDLGLLHGGAQDLRMLHGGAQDLGQSCNPDLLGCSISLKIWLL